MTGVLFDLDRTLLSLPVDIAAVRRDLGAWGAPLGLDLPWRPILRDLASIPAALTPALGEDAAARHARDAWGILDAAEAEAGRRATPRLGAVDLVLALNARSIPLALVTNNGRPGALAGLEAVGIPPACFDVLVCRGEAPHPKPAPDAFRLALQALEAGAPLTRLVSIGDAPSDVEAARALAAEVGPRLEILAFGVLGGFASEAALRGAGPDVLVEEVSALWDTLSGLL